MAKRNIKLVITADDYGRSKSITDHILKCVDEGVINNVNIVANGYAFGYAMQEYKKRPNLGLSIHLDLVEGKPLASPDKVSLLINKEGKFNNSFFSLWLRYLLSNSRRRYEFREQVKEEFSAQIKKIREKTTNEKEICLNSHQHLHLIPFVFRILVELKKKTPSAYIRLVNEPFFFCCDGPKSLANYFGANIVKHALLNYLSFKYCRSFGRKEVENNDHFIGVLFTGNSTAYSTRVALSKLRQLRKRDKIEIVYHPCVAGKGEEEYWKDNLKLRRYYYSPDRKREFEAVRGPELKRVIEDFKNRNSIKN